jgi:hypothetical protein
MSHELDTVCELPAEDRDARLAMIRREILPLATRREPRRDGVAFEFPFDAALERTLEQLVAFERGCCGGLTWNVERVDGGALRLSVGGLPAGSPLLKLAWPEAPGEARASAGEERG